MDAAEQFFASVLPSAGPYVAASIFRTKEAKPVHTVANSIQELVSSSVLADRQNTDSYFCISSIRDKNYTNDKGKRSLRCQANALETRSLIFDIDVDADDARKYKDGEEALVGLSLFQSTLSLPDPTIVCSGYGFHVYWPFELAIPSDDWRKLTLNLKAAASSVDKRLIADPTRVSDSASLLRVPGTRNFKNEPKPVTILNIAADYFPATKYEQLLQRYAPKGELVTRAAKTKAVKAVGTLSLGSNERHELSAVMSKCQWMQQYKIHQAEVSEPVWYCAVGTAKHLKDGNKTVEEIVISFSIGHPGYSEEETLRKLEHCQDNQSGPSFCARHRELEPSWCEGCIYADMVSTPVRLDTVEAPAPPPSFSEEVVNIDGSIGTVTTQIINPPAPYTRGVSGGIYITQLNDEGEKETRRIYEYDIFPMRRLKDEEFDNEHLEISLSLPHDGHKIIKLPNGLLTDPKKFAAMLADKGVLVHPKETNALVAYMIEYARAIQRKEKIHEEFSRFGWRDIEGDSPRFVLGDHVIGPKGEMKRTTLAPYLKQIQNTASAQGDLEVWKKAFAVYEDTDNEAFKLCLLMGFAAPLMPLTPFHGLIYNMDGPSGSGKSTALEIMSSIWGSPYKHHIRNDDNKIPMFNTLGYRQNLPVTLDEATQMSSELLADLAYSITEGRGKNRADQKGVTRLNTTHWKTIVCATSNGSMYEKLGMAKSGNNAHAYRILEVSVGKADQKDRAKIESALVDLRGNHGIAGRIYASHLVDNVKTIDGQVAEITKEFLTRYGMASYERFWQACFGIAHVGGTIAKKLGLLNYDIERTIDYGAKQLPTIRESVQAVEGDALSLLSHFLQTHLRSTIHIKNANQAVIDLSNPLLNLNVRIEHLDGRPYRAYMSIPAIREFCKYSAIDYSWFSRKLFEDRVLISVNSSKRLGAGTNLTTGSIKCWEIDLFHAALSDDVLKPVALSTVTNFPANRGK